MKPRISLTAPPSIVRAPIVLAFVSLAFFSLAGCAERSAPAMVVPAPLSVTGVPATLPEPAPSAVVSLQTLSVVAAGDVIPHPSIKEVAQRRNQKDPAGLSLNQEGWGALFAEVAPALSAADLAFVNLETPVAPDHHKALASKIFNAPPALLDALVVAGVDIVSFANNHVYDQGRTGFVETMERLAKTPLVSLGAGPTCADAAAPRLLTRDGVTVAFIGSTRLHNAHLNRGADEPCSFVLDPKIVAEQAKVARARGADAVVLSVHWGVEYESQPKNWDVDLAHKLLDGGVDVILGHHPHVLQPVEVYEAKDGRITFVAYSLGNFLSGQGLGYVPGLHPIEAGDTRDGALLSFSVVKATHADGSSRAWLADLSVEPVWSETGTRSCLRVRGERAFVRPVIDRQAGSEASALAAAETDPGAKAELERCAAQYEARRRHAGGRLGPAWLLPGANAAAALAGEEG